MRTVICVLLMLTTFSYSLRAQNQSIIYDATAIMNAKYGTNALLIPLPGVPGAGTPAFEMRDPTNGQVITAAVPGLTSDSIIYKILRRNAGLPVGTAPAAIMAAYANNPFLANIISDAPPAKLGATDLSTVDGFFASGESAGIGSNILGNLVNGTADFLIKRAQEEISVSVFEKLKAILEKYPEFSKLFPRTCALIEPIPAYEYSKALVAFKAAIKEDMESFIGNISSLYEIPRYQLLNQRIPALTLLFSASTVLSETNGEKPFAESVSILGDETFVTAPNNYAAIIRLLTIISNSLTDQTLANAAYKPINYIHPKFISNVTHDDPALLALLSRIYLGLLWQKTSGITFVTNAGGTQTVANFLNRWSSAANIGTAITIVDRTLAFLQKADEDLKAIKEWELGAKQITGQNPFNAKRFTYYANLVSGLLDLMTIYKDPAMPAFNTRMEEIAEYFPQFTSSITVMIKNFSEEEYNLGISKLEEVLTIVSKYLETVENNKADADALTATVSVSLTAEKAALNAQVAAIDVLVAAITVNVNPVIELDNESLRQEYRLRKEALQKKIKHVEAQQKNPGEVVFKLSKVIKYVNLLAAISKAENSAVVEELLETYALPAGSSRVKKVTPFNIAVNGYVGGFFGRSGVSGTGFSNRYGLTAPVGFSISTGFNKAGSLSLFLGAFDIGGTIRYKLDNQGKYQQDISLAGIVSPSVHAIYGLPWYLPLSAGIGCQWVSPVSGDADQINLKPSFNAFIAVDIPLFNLTRSK